MWTGKVPSADLISANRWTVGYFANEESLVSAGFPVRPVREIARERGASTDPQQLGDGILNYIGLENVVSQTGELTGFVPRKASEIKSRSKVFRRGDVLFGRLRPELNKVYLAEAMVSEGVCSNEFIVLVCVDSLVLPRYLRHVLASRFVSQFAQKFKSGAALPRMDVSGFFSIPVPVPPIEVQEKLVRQLKKYDDEIASLRKRLQALPQAVTESFVKALEKGSATITLRL